MQYLRALLIIVIAFIYAAPSNASTLDTIRERDYLICGATEPSSGFAQQSEEGFWSGFDVDFCRAISSAIFADPNKVEFRVLSGDARYAPLQIGEVDVMVRNAAWTMRRDISYGLRYVTTSFFDDQAFLVNQSLGVVSAYELDNVTVCVTNDSYTQQNIAEFFFKNQIEYSEVLYENQADLETAFIAGLCDTISAPISFLYSIMRNQTDSSHYRILPERISKEPLGPLVRNGDDEWFNIVRWVLFALLDAEELGVGSLSIESMSDVKTPAIRRLLGLEADFGDALRLDKEWARNIISFVGNYKEIYERNFGPQTGAQLPRGPNALYKQGGLLFSPPLR